eukprot:gene17783-9462_t
MAKVTALCLCTLKRAKLNKVSNDTKSSMPCVPKFWHLLDELIRKIEKIQYSRRNNLELSGFAECRDSEEEETKLQEFFQDLGVTIHTGNIEAGHRIPTKRKDMKKPLIVSFVNRRKRDEVFAVRKQIKGRKIFVNEHLSPHNRWLYTLALEVERKSGYRFLWTINGTPCLRKSENSPVIKVSCPTVLGGL